MQLDCNMSQERGLPARTKSKCAARMAALPGGSVLPQNPNYPTLNLHLSGRHDDGVHLSIGRLQPHFAIGGAEESLECGVGTLDKSHHNLSVLCRLRSLHQDVISIANVVINHRVALYPQNEEASSTSGEITEGEGL